MHLRARFYVHLGIAGYISQELFQFAVLFNESFETATVKLRYRKLKLD